MKRKWKLLEYIGAMYGILQGIMEKKMKTDVVLFGLYSV